MNTQLREGVECLSGEWFGCAEKPFFLEIITQHVGGARTPSIFTPFLVTRRVYSFVRLSYAKHAPRG